MANLVADYRAAMAATASSKKRAREAQHLVLVVGAAGAGKTQVLLQLAQSQFGAAGAGFVLSGAALPAGWPASARSALLGHGGGKEACACCDADELHEAVSELGLCETVFVECDASAEPARLSMASAGLGSTTTVVCVADEGSFAAAFGSNLRWPLGRKRHFVDVLIEQIEAAHVLLLRSRAPGAEAAWLADLCAALKPDATTASLASLEAVLGARAARGQAPRPFDGVGLTPRRSVIARVHYEASRPFEAHRFVERVVRALPVSRPADVLARASRPPDPAAGVLSGVLRCKGALWIKDDHVFDLSHCGGHCTLDEGAPWAGRDRRSAVTLIGPGLDERRIFALFDACLLSDEEYAQYRAYYGGVC